MLGACCCLCKLLNQNIGSTTTALDIYVRARTKTHQANDAEAPFAEM